MEATTTLRWQPRPHVGISAARRVLLAMIAAASILAIRGAAVAQQPHLELSEDFSRPLPPTFELAGAALGSSGTMLLWARNQPYLLVQEGSAFRPVRNELITRPVAAALLPGDSLLEVVDGVRRAIVQLRPDGSTVAERRFEPERSPESAIRTDAGWVLAGTSTDGAYEVVRTRAGEPEQVLYRFDSAVSPLHHPVSTLLSSDGRRVFVAEVEEPFRVVVLDPDHPPSTWPPFSPPALMATGAAGEAPFWVALPVVPLDSGFVRSFSDLRSDVRLLVLFDAVGIEIREQTITVPLGLLGAFPARSMIVAARRTDVLEVVGYRWNWSSAH